MIRHWSKLFLLLTILSLFSACSHSKPNTPIQSEKQLYPFYPGDLSKADEIRIRSGSTGELHTYTDQNQVQLWLESIRDIPFFAAPDREDSVGYLYHVYILEQGEETLSFYTASIGNHYFTDSEELRSKIEQLLLLPATSIAI
ncbi:hypothetical protein [Paenibacillus paeoniae]|uniref:Lipoprotein n=1 Tax=Paenibacillus paeoniae TaxID=2292705 RepID=A0A371PMW8_9BACL|nr:hypothetical protein [Paenibacillus paeoniae]REK77483.1 hypothetical protein DX130_10950 [Paenibacillus paeoniae]